MLAACKDLRTGKSIRSKERSNVLDICSSGNKTQRHSGSLEPESQ